MFLNSIDKKPTVTRDDGITLKDLTVSMFNLSAKNYATYNVYKVPKDFVMRPDLIAEAVYGNTLYAEIILKFNAISNPLSIKENDLILIPDLDSAKAFINTSHQGTSSDAGKAIRDSYKYIDPTKAPLINNNFQNRQIVNGAQAGDLPPNIAAEGETQITYRNGRVYFGPSVATCLQNGMTSSEFLTTVIRSRGQ